VEVAPHVGGWTRSSSHLVAATVTEMEMAPHGPHVAPCPQPPNSEVGATHSPSFPPCRVKVIDPSWQDLVVNMISL
jgi:hypothetical protein